MDANSLCAVCVEQFVREGVGCEIGPVYRIFKVQVQRGFDKVK